MTFPLAVVLAACAWSAEPPAASTAPVPGGAAFLAGRPARAALRAAAEKSLPARFLGSLETRGTRLFMVEHRASDLRARLLMRPAALAEPLLLIDEARLGEGLSLDWWRPSPDGLLVAYGARNAETGAVELRVRQTGGSVDLPDRISRVPNGAVAWLPDRTGFYYARLSAQAQDGPSVLFHALGTDPSRDSPLLSTGAVQELLDAQVSPDGSLLALSVRRSPSLCEVLVQDRKKLAAPPTPLPAGPHCAGRLLFEGKVLHLLFNEGPPRLLSFDLRKPAKPRRSEVPLAAPLPARGAVLLRGALATLSQEHGVSRLQLRGRDGRPRREIPTPGAGSVTALAADPGRDEVFFVWQSLFAPPVLCRYDAAASSFSVLAASPGPDPERFRLRRFEFAAPDGSLRELLLASHHRLKRDGANPVILSALPSAGPGALPAYSPFLISWLEAGGLWAAPEGPLDAALLSAAADRLTGQEYSRPDRIALVSGMDLEPGAFAAAVWQRPDGTALLRWPPKGRAELERTGHLDRAADIQAFLLWRMGREPEAPSPKKGPTRKASAKEQPKKP
jgi:prolyl oligopeptidase